ncbi:unnamed protein product [Ectocarpus sp. CCAP 1310/34]|nr:unnamed protein product [Ectocarpus sp. CCAP 1310/34]
MDSQKAGTRDQTHLRLRHRSVKGENQQPAALLKVHRPAVKHSKDSTNHSKKGKRNGEQGGSTDVAILHDVGQIEQALINAGQAVRQSPLAMGIPDSVKTQLRQPQQMPRRPTSQAYIYDNEGLAADLSRDHCGPDAEDIAPKNDQSRQHPSQGDNVTLEVGTPKLDTGQDVTPVCGHLAAAPCGHVAVPSAGLAATGFRSEDVSGLHVSTAEDGTVPRSRPWAIQKFIMAKGPQAWY